MDTTMYPQHCTLYAVGRWRLRGADKKGGSHNYKTEIRPQLAIDIFRIIPGNYGHNFWPIV